jgi:hypothetical protein
VGVNSFRHNHCSIAPSIAASKLSICGLESLLRYPAAASPNSSRARAAMFDNTARAWPDALESAGASRPTNTVCGSSAERCAASTASFSASSREEKAPIYCSRLSEYEYFPFMALQRFETFQQHQAYKLRSDFRAPIRYSIIRYN